MGNALVRFRLSVLGLLERVLYLRPNYRLAGNETFRRRVGDEPYPIQCILFAVRCRCGIVIGVLYRSACANNCVRCGRAIDPKKEERPTEPAANTV